MFVVEPLTVVKVYKRVRGLERLRPTASGEMMPGALDDADGGDPHSRNVSQKPLLKWVMTTVLPIESAPFYFRHPAFLASFALSLLYFTVLSFSGQMITYLISVGYSSWYVGVARVGSSIFEISATWAAPFLMKKIGVIRAGIWSLAWQMACLAGALGWYFSNYDGMGTNSLFSATGLAVGVALSRMGLWGYDLSAQNIIQDVGRKQPLPHALLSCRVGSQSPLSRKSKMSTEGHSPQSRPPFRTCSRCSPLLPPSFSLARTSSSILSSSPSRPCIPQGGYTLTS